LETIFIMRFYSTWPLVSQILSADDQIPHGLRVPLAASLETIEATSFSYFS
jgi:hypothetical protein